MQFSNVAVEPKTVQAANKWLTKILDIYFENTNLASAVIEDCGYFSKKQCEGRLN